MRWWIFLFLVLATVTQGKASKTKFEYNINSEWSNGYVYSISIEREKSVLGSFHNSSFVEGHNLGIWTMDVDDASSHEYDYLFYKNSATPPERVLSRVEYFIDVDPGHGNGNEIPLKFDLTGSIRYVIPLSEVSKGPHLLGIRTKDNLGIWSQTRQYFFYNRSDGESFNIVRLEYFYTGEGAPNNTYIYEVDDPSSNVELDFVTDHSQLATNQEYMLHIVAIDDTGKRSREITRAVKICDTDPVVAKFDFTKLGTKVSFIDSTRHALRYHWDFGDGRVDTVSNPVHEYATGGNFTVKLIASNFCNSDTIIRTVNVLSLESVFPKSVGNIGYSTINILGGGFTENSIVRLKKGNETIEGIVGGISDNGRNIRTFFNLNGEETGEWTIEVSNDDVALELEEPFKIEDVNVPEIHAEFVGRTQIRAGREGRLTVRFFNTGNVDALMVPVTLQYPNTITVRLADPLARVSDIIGVEDFREDTVSYTINYGSLTYLPLVIPVVPANGFLEVDYLVTSRGGSNNFPVSIMTNPSLFGNLYDDSFSNRILDSSGCWSSFLGAYLTAAGIALEFVSVAPCAASMTLALTGFTNAFVPYFYMNPNEGGVMETVLYSTASVAAGIGGLAAAGITCSGATPPALFGAILAAAGVGLMQVDFMMNPECLDPITELVENTISVVASFDPNEKLGPSNITEDNYNQGISPFTYTIFFENLDSATAAAQEVIILDTLDKNKLDLSTFQLTGYGYGDQRYNIPPGLIGFSNVTPLQRTQGESMDVRFDAMLDTTTGVVRWRFLSIDPRSGELIDDPVDGFLPPNKNPGEGEGYVTFSLKPKQDLNSGTRIENKSLIYFDYNDPIITNTFVNTVDKHKPISKVSALPATIADTVFTVSWSGNDKHSGVRSFDILVSTNDGPYQNWLHDVPITSAEFIGHFDSVYRFMSIAKDYAGNVEDAKLNAEATVQLIFKNSVIEEIETTDITCFGSADGIMRVIYTNATNDLQFSLDGMSFQASPVFEDLSAGMYTVYVKGIKGSIEVEKHNFTIKSPRKLTINFEKVRDDNCSGEDTGEFAVLVEGGSGSYSYRIGHSGPFLSSNIFKNVEAGTHQVTVRDSNGCDQTGEITIKSASPLTMEFEDIQSPICPGTATGSFSILIKGGTGDFVYKLGENGTFQSSNVFENIEGGTYKIIVRDENGCEQEGELAVLSPSPLTLEFDDIVSPDCSMDAKGSFLVRAKGGTGDYLFKLGENGIFQSSGLFQDVIEGEHLVTVQDANGCEQSSVVEIQAIGETPPIPTITIQGIDGISEEVFLQSSSPINNQWIRNGEVIPGATDQSLKVSEAGVFQVTVSNSGCSSLSEAVAITSLPEVLALNLTLYPNPAQSDVYLRLGREVYVDKVIVYSSSGVVLQEINERMGMSNIRIELTGLPGGSYIIQVEGVGIFERLKLIKK